MKEAVRRGLFETNSSSVHSITMCSDDEWTKWVNGEIFFDSVYKNFYEPNQDIERARACQSWDEAWDLHVSDKRNEYFNDCYHRFLTYEEFNDWEYIDLETYDAEYTTDKGETVHAFGYYGHD